MSLHLLLASTSTVHGQPYLGYFKEAWTAHFAQGTGPVVFVPYARPGGTSWDDYTAHATQAFEAEGIPMRGIHSFASPAEAMTEARGVFIGGGNTFVLLKTLIDTGAFHAIDAAVRNDLPYMGSSAGSNVAGRSVGTTNDMPIVYPPQFEAFGWIPYNLNPHYLDPTTDSTHMGETRETRIKEFHQFNDVAVMGLREGTWLEIHGTTSTLHGPLAARIFTAGNVPVEMPSGPFSL
ncbi:MAG: (alpha)-aspartyl dipeptidase [Cryomorphaceae bacterium BACL7 MAG-120910-bin2]|mgnify:CR=1 FL=1|jgi:dipeptidase E|nr:MAG: (alpha)-aspartyl dipeptidase [Cryomorphaceae bacterium BACL7 MAG-120910-bin2]KRO69452.1 MAG: (alpha)-aspartyl dipeptidase [Cryomorphaceae bacterium BACL7 MAG-120322-bin74]KRO82710.1 MAG: (alpha)-aspartyl dipeptidase [Cryomorphaceae bacterium BACL7 MAG-121220-bin83]